MGNEEGIEKEESLSADEIKKLIEKDKLLRKEKCIIKINAALEEYNCSILPKVILADGMLPKSEILIVAK